MKQRWVAVLAIGLLAALAPAMPAMAAPMLTFDQDTFVNTGTLTYDGSGGSLVGSGILFNWVSATDVSSNNGVKLFCDDGCVLNFTTGSNISEGALYQWNGGGTFTISGDLFTGQNGTGDAVASGTLVSGSFTGPVMAFNFGSFLQAIAAGTDSKSEDLLAFYGLSPQGFVFANNDITTTGISISGNGGFSANVATSDFVNTSVPEPGTILLLGFGLVGAGLARRRLN